MQKDFPQIFHDIWDYVEFISTTAHCGVFCLMKTRRVLFVYVKKKKKGFQYEELVNEGANPS